jgi:hypothetical protein
MTNRRLSTFEGILGLVGLFLILVVRALAERGYSAQQTIGGQLTGFVARRAIDGVAIIGWLVDRLPVPPLDAWRHEQTPHQETAVEQHLSGVVREAPARRGARGSVSRRRSPDSASGWSRVRRDAGREASTVAIRQCRRAGRERCDVERTTPSDP